MILQKKVCLIGDFAVGKTSLIRRYVFDEFSESYLTTIGVHITKKELSVKETPVTLIIWDLAGNNGIHEVTPSYMAGAAGALFVGDLSRPWTIDTINGHLAAFHEVNPRSAGVLVFNKTDLMDGPVDRDGIALNHGLDQGYEIFLTSCKTGRHVEDAFSVLASLLAL